MLREVPNVVQLETEPRRRWFFSHEQDLWVWFGENDELIGFQLAYGKYRHECAIRWKKGKGFAHDAVDDGENAGVIKQAPILVMNGAFHAAQVLSRFLELSRELPADIVEFVRARLEEHPEFRRETDP